MMQQLRSPGSALLSYVGTANGGITETGTGNRHMMARQTSFRCFPIH